MVELLSDGVDLIDLEGILCHDTPVGYHNQLVRTILENVQKYTQRCSTIQIIFEEHLSLDLSQSHNEIQV